MKPTSVSTVKHQQVQPGYRFIMRCEELNIMYNEGFGNG